MEDGFPLFDPNDEAARQEQKLKEYYEEFSANARRRLLAKTIIRPTTVYDILYPQTRGELLSKNVPINSDLEGDAKIIRDKLIANFVTNETDLEKISEDFRKSLLARAKIQKSLSDLSVNSETFRKNLLSKNLEKKTNLESDSDAFRKSNISKNANNISSQQNLESINKAVRDINVSKNNTKDQDLLRDSEEIRNQFRKNNIHKNIQIQSDLEKDSLPFRNQNKSRNNKRINVDNIDSFAPSKRNSELSKNIPKNSNLDESSKAFREDLKSKNIKKDIDLLSFSEDIGNQFRKNNLSKNSFETSDIEIDSSVFRKNNLNKNTPNNSDIEKDSDAFRNSNIKKLESKINLEDLSRDVRLDNLSKNNPENSNLESDSAIFRDNSISKNKPSSSNLEEDSQIFRQEDLSKNSPKNTDLEFDSIPFRNNLLSINSPRETNLESDSFEIREDALSLNKPKASNLELDSAPFRQNVLSFNSPSPSDLEVDSVPFRQNVLSFNSPIFSDLENDSVSFRQNVLSFNSPSSSDLETDSVPFYVNNISANVPINSDIETDSVLFRQSNLAPNVPNFNNLLIDSEDFRQNNLSSNVPSDSSLSLDSIPFRQNNLASNVPINSNVLSDSSAFREDNLSSNVDSNTNLLLDSQSFRDAATSKNSGFGLLGVNVDGAGTSAFLGISRVFTQGILIRQLLLSKNKSKFTNLINDSEVFRENNIKSNKWQYGNNEYTSSNQNWKLGRIMQGSFNTNLVDYSPIEYPSPTAKAIFSTDDFLRTKGRDLQRLYGSSQIVDFPTGRKDRNINDALYSINTNLAKGGEFLDGFFNRNTFVTFTEGFVTETIRKYNQERNAFNLYNLQPGNPDSLNELNNISQEGFQDLIQRTIGSFKAVSQLRTITTPSSVITRNQGAYYAGGSSDSDIMRPEEGELGSPESMMSKTVPGNPFEDEDFLAGRRGVKQVVNTIKRGNTPLANNFDPQNNRAYVTGVKRDGSPRISRQRFTIANPYAPGNAGRLLFSIKNYSSGDQYFFPPYIESMSNQEVANWNSTSFLGRPEAVYTYNNSSRDASISFYVLTDYAQRVDLGRNWDSPLMDKVSANIPGHFTQSDYSQNERRGAAEQKLQEERQKKTEELNEIDAKLKENSTEFDTVNSQNPTIDPSDDNVNDIKRKNNSRERNEKFQESKNKRESSEFTEQKNSLSGDLGKIDDAIGNFQIDFNSVTNYSETNSVGNNVYNVNLTKNEFSNGEIISKPEDTINRINAMRSTLMFQPAYFSGDKVDFVRKVEFLSKLTRPSAAFEWTDDEGNSIPRTGFAFTKPPICHIQLGDWWNHDIVVNSVNFDYAGAPWTLDGGRVQPMWVLVSINFNIIGPYGSANSRPPLSTDKGGMFSPTKGVSVA